MKKSIVISVIMFLIISIFTGSVSAASATVNVGVSNANPSIGNIVTVTISFSQPVGTASLNLSYNNSVVQYTGSSAWKASDTGTSVKLDYIDANFENKTITTMTVTFKVISAGSANFTASNVVISNANGEELTVNVSGGATINVVQNTDNQPKPNPDPNPVQKPSTPTNPSKKPTTNNNTNNNNTNTITTQTPEANITNIDNTISEITSNDNHNNQVNDISNAEQNEIKSDNNENKPNYTLYLIIGIIALAIIVIIIVIICKIKNN